MHVKRRVIKIKCLCAQFYNIIYIAYYINYGEIGAT